MSKRPAPLRAGQSKPGMPKPTPLSSTRHRDLGWTPSVARLSGGEAAVVPLALEEIGLFAIRFPIVFRETQREVEPVIPAGALANGATPLTGPGGEWKARAIPFFLRRGPFELVRAAGETTIFVDENSLGPAATAKHPLFGADCRPEKQTADHLGQLVAWTRGLERAARAGALLRNAHLLEPWRVDGSLRVVDPERLAALSGAVAAKLHAEGALRLAHASELSLGMIEARPTASQPLRTANTLPDDDPFLAALRETIE